MGSWPQSLWGEEVCGRAGPLTFPVFWEGNVEEEVLGRLSNSLVPDVHTLPPLTFPLLSNLFLIWATLLLVNMTDQTKQSGAADNQGPFWPHVGLLACWACKRGVLFPQHIPQSCPPDSWPLARSHSLPGLSWLGTKKGMWLPFQAESLHLHMWPWAVSLLSGLWVPASAGREAISGDHSSPFTLHFHSEFYICQTGSRPTHLKRGQLGISWLHQPHDVNTVLKTFLDREWIKQTSYLKTQYTPHLWNKSFM